MATLYEVCVTFPRFTVRTLTFRKTGDLAQGQSRLSDTKDPQVMEAGGNQHNNIINTYIYDPYTKQLCGVL